MHIYLNTLISEMTAVSQKRNIKSWKLLETITPQKGSFWKAFLQKVLKMTNGPSIHLSDTMHPSDIIQETDGRWNRLFNSQKFYSAFWA